MKLNYEIQKKYLTIGIILLIIGLILPTLTENYLFDIIVQIRQAINSGDSGYLIVASMINCILSTLPLTFIYISLECFSYLIRTKIKFNDFTHNILLITIFMGIYFFSSIYLAFSLEITNTLTGLVITLFLVYLAKQKQDSIVFKVIISFQVFFYMQWFNVMPIFNIFRFGNSDIPVSIKITSAYLENTYLINSIGFSFIIPLIISSIMTAFIFRISAQNIKIMEENYERAIAIESMQNKIMDNRVYQEINALTHDLKTPLSTIQGLSSLLVLTKDMTKLENYISHINQAVSKMTEMISSFLYGTSRQSLEVSSLVKYIRSQIPVEDENISFINNIPPNLPCVYVNKIRIARALVNIIENAILAPNSNKNKIIKLTVKYENKFIKFIIEDNGLGISKEDIEKIWIIGYSSNNTTGLGLPFAKQTVDENGGEISLSSKYGEGTVVTVSLPIDNKKGGIPCKK